MATNQLLPFATAPGANVIPYASWSALTAVLANGFSSGIASSEQFNRLLSQGALASYALGQFVVDETAQDADLDAAAFYTKFKNALKAYMHAVTPIGSFLCFAGATVPDGYLLCNGAAVSRTTYAALYAVIGDTYGAGDGSTTFNLPNCDGRVLQGVSDLTKVGVALNSQLPNIYGSIGTLFGIFDAATAVGALYGPNGNTKDFPYTPTSGTLANLLAVDASRSNSIYGAGSKVQNPALQVLVAIRYE